METTTTCIDLGAEATVRFPIPPGRFLSDHLARVCRDLDVPILVHNGNGHLRVATRRLGGTNTGVGLDTTGPARRVAGSVWPEFVEGEGISAVEDGACAGLGTEVEAA